LFFYETNPNEVKVGYFFTEEKEIKVIGTGGREIDGHRFVT